MKYDITHAINSLYPNCSWVVRGDSYEGLEWKEDSVECPTEEELMTEVKRLQDEYDALEYQRERREKYPSIEDQLDALFHKGYDGWKAEIQKVKDKVKKPK